VLQVVLYQPEIPQNTGTIVRTCAAAGAKLHLIRPLGFRWDQPQLKRAGLDYWDGAEIMLHDSWAAFVEQLGPESRLFALSTKANRPYHAESFWPDDYLLFGPESRGLPAGILAQFPSLTIPMPGQGRSLNLAVAVAVVLFEGLRQLRVDSG
jgi:tRNA (cytidine/uridine-2'-O-)-methyltransferase